MFLVNDQAKWFLYHTALETVLLQQEKGSKLLPYFLESSATFGSIFEMVF